MTTATERVWDYPRPPRVVACEHRVRVEFAGRTIADSNAALRVLETSHPPTIYVPPDHVTMDRLTPNLNPATICEFKGLATYFDLEGGERLVRSAAWTYQHPTPRYEALRDYICFYPSKMDCCFLGDELVTPQPGDFYGGWITRNLIGPFKGPPGTLKW